MTARRPSAPQPLINEQITLQLSRRPLRHLSRSSSCVRALLDAALCSRPRLTASRALLCASAASAPLHDMHGGPLVPLRHLVPLRCLLLLLLLLLLLRDAVHAHLLSYLVLSCERRSCARRPSVPCGQHQ